MLNALAKDGAWPEIALVGIAIDFREDVLGFLKHSLAQALLKFWIVRTKLLGGRSLALLAHFFPPRKQLDHLVRLGHVIASSSSPRISASFSVAATHR